MRASVRWGGECGGDEEKRASNNAVLAAVPRWKLQCRKKGAK